jgi:hypothetical protein
MSSRRANDRRDSRAEKVTDGQKQPWLIHFFRRHHDDDSAEPAPAMAFLQACPSKVEAMMLAVVKAVADAPPPAFSGGGK